jgi:hypothetical protein
MSTLRLTATAPTFGGHHESVVVGGRKFGLPPHTAVRKIRSSDGRELAYCLGYDDSLHLLSNAGEIAVPLQLVDSIKQRYFPQRQRATTEQEAGR